MSARRPSVKVALAASWIPALVAGGLGLYVLGTGCDSSLGGIYDGGGPGNPQQVGMGGDVDTIFGPSGFEPVSENFLFTPLLDGTPDPAQPVSLDFTDYTAACVPLGTAPQSSTVGGPGPGQHLLTLLLSSSQPNTYTLYDPLLGAPPTDGGPFATAVLTEAGVPALYGTSGSVTVDALQGTSITGTFSISVSADPGGAQATSLTGPFYSPDACPN